MPFRPLALLLLMLALLPGPALAQRDPWGGLPPVAGQGADNGPRIVQAIQDAQAFCASLRDPAYRIDCLAERLEFIGRQIPRGGAYAEVGALLMRYGDWIGDVAQRYADPSKPGARWGQPAGAPRAQRATRRLGAVRPDALALAGREVAALIDEAQTQLLRSSAGTGIAPQVQRIAAAVASNKVLLRSS